MKIYVKNKDSEIFTLLFSILEKLEKIDRQLCLK